MAWEEFEYAEVETVLPAKILCVDELAQFVEVTDRKLMRLVDKFQGNIQSIARLGRAEHIHVVLATQSAMGNLFPSSLKNNVSQRFICGRVEANISRIAIDTEEGDSLPLTKGAYLGYSKQETLQFQGFYTPTKRVLSLGTVKPGYDPKTGRPIESEEELTPVSDYTEEERSKEGSEESSTDSIDADDISFDLSSESDDVSEAGFPTHSRIESFYPAPEDEQDIEGDYVIQARVDSRIEGDDVKDLISGIMGTIFTGEVSDSVSKYTNIALSDSKTGITTTNLEQYCYFFNGWPKLMQKIVQINVGDMVRRFEYDTVEWLSRRWQ